MLLHEPAHLVDGPGRWRHARPKPLDEFGTVHRLATEGADAHPRLADEGLHVVLELSFHVLHENRI